MLYSKADLDNSVKLVDNRDGKIYGLLIFSDYSISNGSPLVSHNYWLNHLLGGYKQVNGHSFIIDERLRGTNFDKKMLFFNIDYLKKYDLIWIAVDKTLKSQNYWKRLGFEEILDINEANFYVNSFNKNILSLIFIFKAISENEKDNNR